MVSLAQLFDINLSNRLDDIPDEKWKLVEECSPAFHLSKDDVPVMMVYGSRMETPVKNRQIGIHHPRFGKYLQDKMKLLEIECEIVTGAKRSSAERTQQTIEFMRKNF